VYNNVKGRKVYWITENGGTVYIRIRIIYRLKNRMIGPVHNKIGFSRTHSIQRILFKTNPKPGTAPANTEAE